MRLFTIGHMPQYMKMQPSIFMTVWHKYEDFTRVTIAFMWPFYREKWKHRSFLYDEEVRYKQ